MVVTEIERLNNIYGCYFKQYPDEAIAFMNFVLGYFAQKENITIMEIGVCYAANLLLMGNILQLHKKNVYAIGLDLPNIELWGGHPIDPREEIKRGSPTFKYDILIGDSHLPEQLEKVKKLTTAVDLLFIDGDHSEIGCRKDLEMYKDLVPKNGLIVVHDTKNFPTWSHVEVWKVWEELKTNYSFYEFSFHTNYGIGVIIQK